MNEALESGLATHDLPEPSFKPPRKLRFSVVWVVPILAALAATGIGVRSLINRGPTITITFDNAEGLDVEKTEVRYKNVIVGKVTGIALSSDRAHVVVTVDVTRDASSFAVEDTHFWVVRPRVATSGITGISTLFSGAYIGVDVGTSTTKRKAFDGLENAPAFLRDQRGRLFTMRSSDPGSLVSGSPVYYRRIEVGTVSSTELVPDGKSAEVRVFVRAPYDHFVTSHTRFWNSSGLDLSVNADGLKLNTESLATVIAGGVTFQEFDEEGPGEAVAPDTVFSLYEDRVAAFSQPQRDPVLAHLSFDGDTRGLALNTPVEFRGVSLGTVTSVSLALDPRTRTFRTEVVATLYPERMGPAYVTLRDMSAAKGETVRDGLQDLVDERGLHAQLRTGNLLLGQVYIALDFFKNSAKTNGPRSKEYVSMPTEPGTTDDLQKELHEILKKIDAIPFDEIGTHLRDTLKSASSVMAQLDQQIAPEARKIFQQAQEAIQSLRDNVAAPDSALQSGARATLTQIERAAYSLRVLSEYLEQHPESIIRGKSDVPLPPRSAGASQ